MTAENQRAVRRMLGIEDAMDKNGKPVPLPAAVVRFVDKAEQYHVRVQGKAREFKWALLAVGLAALSVGKELANPDAAAVPNEAAPEVKPVQVAPQAEAAEVGV